jgi:hypothetical protein
MSCQKSSLSRDEAEFPSGGSQSKRRKPQNRVEKTVGKIMWTKLVEAERKSLLCQVNGLKTGQ